jgi:hypothetical protein
VHREVFFDCVIINEVTARDPSIVVIIASLATLLAISIVILWAAW